jgi:tetratricopeptide (TPR) repeat protein
MASVTVEDSERLFRRAAAAFDAGETAPALALLERALKEQAHPAWHSYLGYCIAKERGQVRRGIELCREALVVDAENPVHYLNLARIHLVTGKKGEALAVLREGMSVEENGEILALLNRLGTRKPPVLSFLSRDHFLNKILGRILSRLRLR